MKKEYFTTCTEETVALGRAIGECALRSGRRRLFIAYRGEMGVGKTALTRGFVSAVSPSAAVRSPTFSVVNEYRGGAVPVFHFDAYRIEDSDDLASIGYDDYLAADAFIFCEWSESIAEDIPHDALTLTILRGENEGDRHIILEGVGYEDIMP